MTEPHPPEPTPAYPPRPGVRPPARRRRWGRALRGAGIVVGTALGLVLLGVLGTLVWLHTGSGAREVGGLVADKARGAIRGNFTVRGIELRGLLTICAEQVDLRDPDGNPALAADRICLRINPLALRLNRVLLSDVQLVRPRIDIAAVEEEGGKRATTLSRALEPRTPKATRPPSWDSRGSSMASSGMVNGSARPSESIQMRRRCTSCASPVR